MIFVHKYYWGRLQSPQLCLEIGSFFPFKVPLVHDRALMDYEMPPYVCLRVRGMAALKQPAKNGPLLAHCGGPGSGRDCAMVMSNWASVIFLLSTLFPCLFLYKHTFMESDLDISSLPECLRQIEFWHRWTAFSDLRFWPHLHRPKRCKFLCRPVWEWEEVGYIWSLPFQSIRSCDLLADFRSVFSLFPVLQNSQSWTC